MVDPDFLALAFVKSPGNTNRTYICAVPLGIPVGQAVNNTAAIKIKASNNKNNLRSVIFSSLRQSRSKNSPLLQKSQLCLIIKEVVYSLKVIQE